MSKTPVDHVNTYTFTEFANYESLAQYFKSISNGNIPCHLFIVENVCPCTIALLGGKFDIDPQFFADHLENFYWYKVDENISDRLPALPSSQRQEQFIHFRFVVARKLHNSRDDYSSSVI